VGLGVRVEGGRGVKVGAARWVAATMVAMASGDVDGMAAGAQPVMSADDISKPNSVRRMRVAST
jgi:hypothetical protein